MKIEIEESEFKRLLDERDHLQRQVDELQAHATQRLEERRLNDITYQVTEFHLAFQQPVVPYPVVDPEDAHIRMRCALVGEECFEFLEACGFPLGTIWELLKFSILNGGRGHFSIEEAADALGDIDYVVEGSRLTFGIHRQRVANEIHRSNMAKVGATKNEFGKIQKPPGWTPPNIRKALGLT